MDTPSCYDEKCPNKQGGKTCYGEKGCGWQKAVNDAVNAKNEEDRAGKNKR